MPRIKRPVEVYKKSGKPFRTDWELVELAQKGDNAAFEEMWEKYFLLRQKKKFSFINWCKDHNISWNEYQDYVEQWDCDAYEKFKNQMAGVRLNDLKSKGYTPDSWGITIRLMGYFDVVNRSYSNRLMKKKIYEVEERSVGSTKAEDSKSSTTNIDIASCEDVAVDDKNFTYLARDIFAKSFEKMYSDLDESQQKLIKMKENKVPVQKICDSLGVSRKDVSSTMKFAKKRLSFWVEDISRKNGVPMMYEDILEAFTA